MLPERIQAHANEGAIEQEEEEENYHVSLKTIPSVSVQMTER